MGRWFGRSQDTDAVTKAWREDLETSRRHSERRQPGLAQRQADFVVDGVGTPPVPPPLGTHGYPFHPQDHEEQQPAARRVLEGLGAVPPEVALRYARLLAADSHVHWTAPTPPFPGGEWAGALADEIVRHVHGPDVQLPLSVAEVEHLAELAGATGADVVVAALTAEAPRYYPAGQYAAGISRLTGWSDAVRRHADLVRPAIAAARGEATPGGPPAPRPAGRRRPPRVRSRAGGARHRHGGPGPRRGRAAAGPHR